MLPWSGSVSWLPGPVLGQPSAGCGIQEARTQWLGGSHCCVSFWHLGKSLLPILLRLLRLLKPNA